MEIKYQVPAKQRDISIIYCLSGTTVVEINDNCLSMKKGEIGFIPQGSFFRIKDSSEDYSSVELSIPEIIFKDHFPDIKNIVVTLAFLSRYPVIRLQEEEQDNFLGLINLCKSLNKQKGDFHEKCLFNVYLSIVYFICGVTTERNNFLELPEGGERQYQHFITFLDLLSRHCCNERNVKFYADKLFMTPQYLSKITNTISGRSALSWINEFVIAEAKQRLKFSGESIQEISYQLNFSDQSVFGKYFKRFTGMSPNNYKYQLPLT